MGVCKFVDAILFLYFLLITIVAPLFDAQTCLPSHLIPDLLKNACSWYAHEYGDYLAIEKPYFFVGLVALELVVQWPLSIANLYGIITKKSWYTTTCLIQGVVSFTSMVAILAELTGSQRASDKLLMFYYPFLGFSLLAVLRGIVPVSKKTTSTHAPRSSAARKKKA